MLSIKLATCCIKYEPRQWCCTTFNDGAEYGACPNDTPHYYIIAHRCGYGDDLWQYCFEHEVCHAFLSEAGFFTSVVYALAHGLESQRPNWDASQEAVVHMFQRWLRANERPIIGSVDWDWLKWRCLTLLDGGKVP